MGKELTIIKIDLDRMTIGESYIEKGNLNDIYKHIGNDCRVFACPVTFPNGDAIYCDDEALLNPNIKKGIIAKDWSYPIYGNCLIIGTNRNTGDSTSSKTTVKDVMKMFEVVWR